MAETNSTIQGLRESREALIKEASNLADTADEEKRSLTEAEEKRFGECLSQADALETDIKRRERLLAAQTSLTVPEGRVTQLSAPTHEYTVHGTDGASATSGMPKLPAGLRRTGKLKAFSGPGAEYNAYLSGMFLAATIWGHAKARQWCASNIPNFQALAMGESSNTAGGALVPEQMENAIIDLRETYGVFRQNARARTMTTETLSIPRGTGHVTVYFPGENAEITESARTFDTVMLVAKKMAALTTYSTELDEDAIISVADDLTMDFAWALALKEDQIGFLGDGTSTYGGMNGLVLMNDGNHAGSIYTALTGNTAFSTLDLVDFHSITGKLPEYARPRAKWYISRPGFADSMERLAYAGGGNTVQTIGGGSGPSFLGYPVVIVQVMNSTLSAQTSTFGLAYFGDLMLAASIGTRRGITVARSAERYFEMDKLAIRVTQRIDIVPHDLGDGSTAGPLIGLKTPAS